MSEYHKIQICKDTDTAREFIKQWREENIDLAKNVVVNVRKHCDGKEVTIDYDLS